jgi:hypothetical protein
VAGGLQHQRVAGSLHFFPQRRCVQVCGQGAIEPGRLDHRRNAKVTNRDLEAGLDETDADGCLRDDGANTRVATRCAEGRERAERVARDANLLDVDLSCERVIGRELLEMVEEKRDVERTIEKGIDSRADDDVPFFEQLDEGVALVIGGRDDVAVAREHDRVEGRLHADAALAVREKNERERAAIGLHVCIAHGVGRERAERVFGDRVFQRVRQIRVQVVNLFLVVVRTLHGRVPNLGHERTRAIAGRVQARLVDDGDRTDADREWTHLDGIRRRGFAGGLEGERFQLVDGARTGHGREREEGTRDRADEMEHPDSVTAPRGHSSREALSADARRREACPTPPQRPSGQTTPRWCCCPDIADAACCSLPWCCATGPLRDKK